MRRVMNIQPGRARWLLALLPFALILLMYVMGSAQRRAENPSDKVLPPISEMASAIHRVAFEEDKRTGQYLFWTDTGASLKRLGIGLSIATAIALVLGLLIGLLPVGNATFSPLTTVLSMIPPMAKARP